MSSLEELVEKLKMRRKAKGLSIREWEEYSGYCGACLWHWEHVKHLTGLQKFIDWAQSLGLRVELEDDNDEGDK
jgi:hypothetical protein